MTVETPSESQDQPPANLGRRVLHGTFYLGIAQYLSLAVGLIKTPILARLISPDVFGVVAFALSTTSFIQLLRLELREIVISDPDGHPARLTTQFVIETISSLPGLLGALVVYLVWPGVVAADIWTAIFTILGVRMLTAILSTPVYILQRDIQQKTITQFTLLGTILGFGVSVGLALTGHPLAALLADSVIPMAVLSLGAWAVTKWTPSVTWDRDVVRDVYGFAFTLWTGALLGKIIYEFDDLLVGRIRGDRALGFYSRAYSTAKMPMDVFGGMIGGIALSTYSQAFGQSQQLLDRAYRAATWLLTRIIAWSSIVILAAAEEFTAVFLGPQWGEVPLLIRLMFLYILGRPLFQNNAQLLIAKRREKLVQRTLILQAIILIVLAPPAVYFYGAAGASVAVSLMAVAGFVSSHRYAARSVDAPLGTLYGFPMLLMLILTPLIYGIGLIVQTGPLVMFGIKGVVTTAIFAALTWLFERGEIDRVLETLLPNMAGEVSSIKGLLAKLRRLLPGRREQE